MTLAFWIMVLVCGFLIFLLYGAFCENDDLQTDLDNAREGSRVQGEHLKEARRQRDEWRDRAGQYENLYVELKGRMLKALGGTDPEVDDDDDLDDDDTEVEDNEPSVKLEVGKWYVDGEGVVIGPMRKTTSQDMNDTLVFPFAGYDPETESDQCYTANGQFFEHMADEIFDIKREATEEEIASCKQSS